MSIKQSYKKPDYQCIRCGYTCKRRDYMYKHLYQKQKQCNGCYNDILLTEDIKKKILENRVYVIKNDTNVINQTIYNYNILNNFITQMDTISKLEKLLEYQDIKHIDFEDQLDDKFLNKIKRLEETSTNIPYVLKLDNLLDLINYVTKVDPRNIKEFSILFDKKLGRLKIYRDKEWFSFIEDFGIKEIINLIKSYYLDTYELYLIRNLHADNAMITNRPVLYEHIEIYYRFICIFDLMPTILGLEDNDILGNCLTESNLHCLEERYMKLYYDIKTKLKKKEQDHIKKQISNIIKDNTLQNIDTLNQVIFDILKIDEEFKNYLFENYNINNCKK